jgi:hypothetical protein
MVKLTFVCLGLGFLLGYVCFEDYCPFLISHFWIRVFCLVDDSTQLLFFVSVLYLPMIFVFCYLYSYKTTSKAPNLLEPLYRDHAMNAIERYSTTKAISRIYNRAPKRSAHAFVSWLKLESGQVCRSAPSNLDNYYPNSGFFPHSFNHFRISTYSKRAS